MEADISTLYKSDFYQVLNFKCRCLDCKTSKPEYVESFSISFVRKGNFIFNVFRNSFDSHTGRILLTKPGYEHTVTHVHDIPDECTIIEFTGAFYHELYSRYKGDQFLSNEDIHSLQINTTPETEYLHHLLLSHIFFQQTDRLQIDLLILEIVEQTLDFLSYTEQNPLSDRFKRNHLTTVEQAKQYMMTNFSEDISLMDIASNCFVSTFHFSRIFKTFVGVSPHAFLLSVRLKNAEIMLKASSRPVTEIAFVSGFNSLAHFSATFNERFGYSPVKYREKFQ
ncbi:helix-turn-helix transcriptional regulator [Sphingobacterium sp. N143]|nr:helix-turn-helix transcriptional regulator [Sphingobacterium sp. N143]